MGNKQKSNGARKDCLHLPRPPRRRLGGDGGAGTRKRRLPPRQPRVREPLSRGRRRQRRRGCRHWPSRRRWLPLDCGFLHALLWQQYIWWSGGRRARRRHGPPWWRWLPLDSGFFLALLWQQHIWRSRGGGGLLEPQLDTPHALLVHESASLIERDILHV